HQNKFVPIALLTRTGRIPVNTARQNLSSQAATTSTARKVNTARPIVNEIRQRNNFYKSHSPIRSPFNKSTAPKANFTNHKVNTARDKTVSAVRGYRETAVKTTAGTDISEITRKPSKSSKHGHENGRVNKSRKQSQEKSNPQSKWSNHGQQKDEIKRSVEQGKGLEASPNGYK
ncbi:hypothetical protein Tco_1468815, partial [Tanacetum coccineum]